MGRPFRFAMASYKVLKERTPENHTTIVTVEVSRWHSFLTSSSFVREFLFLGHEASKSGRLEVYKAPEFVRLSKRQEEKLWQALQDFRDEQKRNKNLIFMKKKYGEYFEEPIKGPQNYR